jgi:glutathione S-transferase
MLRIWGNADSVNVQKVLWCCEELGLDYERIDAGRHFGVVDTPAFRALNPNGLVPTLEDDGFVVWESGAILRYLAARHGAGTLWPLDPRARADADRWVDWSNSSLWPSLLPLFRAFYRTPPEQRDDAQVERDRQEALTMLQVLDAQLAHHPWAGGECFTMADIALGCPAWRWFAMPIERPVLPGLQRWFDKLVSRPAYARIVMLALST